MASIGNDLLLRIWSEDPSQPPNSGRRFKRVCELPSSSRTPFVSLDIKCVDNIWHYLAVIDRQGLLTIYQPATLDDFGEWSQLSQFNVQVPVPGRGEETSFKVRFDQNVTPLPWFNSITDDREMISLVVCSLKDVRIYSTVPEITSNSQARSLTFYEAFRLPTHPALIRDVQWATFNIRGSEWIATSCKDGSIRVYEIDIVEADSGQAGVNGSSEARSQPTRQQLQSSLTTQIVRRKAGNQDATSTTSAAHREPGTLTYPFPFQYRIQKISTLEDAHNDAWALDWDPTGQCLMSSGADGVVKIWKKSVMNGEWLLFSDQAIQLENDDSGNAPEREEE